MYGEGHISTNARKAKGKPAVQPLCSWLGWGRNSTERAQPHRREKAGDASHACSRDQHSGLCFRNLHILYALTTKNLCSVASGHVYELCAFAYYCQYASERSAERLRPWEGRKQVATWRLGDHSQALPAETHGPTLRDLREWLFCSLGVRIQEEM